MRRITGTAALGGAAILAACGAGLAGGTGRAAGPEDAPFACVLEAERSPSGLDVAGRIEAAAAVSGRYRLRLSGAGMEIDQSGDFSAAKGESVTLGTATLSRAPGLAGRLEIETPEGRFVCPVRAPLEAL